MNLPKNTTPVYTTTIPSNKKPFKFRPFLVKDEKALLIAQESDDINVMLDTVKDVIKSCSVSDIDVESLASFDIEFLFLQLRSKSVGEIVELIFACDDDHGEDNAKARTTVAIDIDKAAVLFQKNHTPKISLFGDVGMVMKYPTIETLKAIESSVNNIDAMFDIMSDCIDYIYQGDEIFPAKETEKSELIEFLNNLTAAQFDLVQEFFRTMPSLRVDVTYTCPVCEKVHNKYMEGLASFF